MSSCPWWFFFFFFKPQKQVTLGPQLVMRRSRRGEGGLGFCEPLWHVSLGTLGNNSCKNCFSSDLWADGAFIYKKGKKKLSDKTLFDPWCTSFQQSKLCVTCQPGSS